MITRAEHWSTALQLELTHWCAKGMWNHEILKTDIDPLIISILLYGSFLFIMDVWSIDESIDV